MIVLFKKLSKLLVVFLTVFTVGVPVVSTVNATPVYAISAGGHAAGGEGGHATAHADTAHTSTHATEAHASPATRFGSTTANTANPGSRFSEGHTSTSNPATRAASTFTDSFSTDPAMRAHVFNSKATESLGTARYMLGNSSYTSYFKNPYSYQYYQHGNYTNLWFYYWMWNQNLNSQQHNILVAQGINHDQLKNSHMYKVVINDSGTKKVIVVTKSQYNKINVGDKLKVSNGKLYLNGSVLK